jgi:hypothetical protein
MSYSAPRRRARAAAGLLVLLAGGLGCGSGAGTEPGDGSAGTPDAGSGGVDGGARVRLGTGREAFEEVPADGHVPLIMGLQGGYHVWTSFLIYELPAEVVRMELSTRWDGVDGSEQRNAGNVSLRPVVDAEGSSALASLGWPMSIFNPTCANGRRLLLDLRVIDDAGIALTDSRAWIVDVAEEYRASDCGL